MEDLQAEVVALKKLLEGLAEENLVMKQELNELRKMCAQGERVHQSEMLNFKKDLERLKKTQPDVYSIGQQNTVPPPSPDIYTRVKGMKKRPQSVHEISILPPSFQGHLQADKVQTNGSIVNGGSDSNGTESYSLVAQPPFYFTLYNFAHYKKNGLRWFSEPFYTHCHGYKMCVAVDAGGSSVGEGTHISLHVYLLPGEYDNSLPWPFRGVVRIQVLNQRRDSNHFDSAIEFTEDTPLVNSARVTCSDRSTEWGNPLLVPHSQLGHDSTTDCELLKYDKLKVVVSEVEMNH